MTGWPFWYCPFIDEVEGNGRKKRDRRLRDPKPCTPAMRNGCGCKTDGVPLPFRAYTRSAS